MSQSTDSADLTHFDVRPIPCRIKHGLIFQRWTELDVGGHFVLINDHDPVPLYYQFAGQFPGAFAWEYLPAGPDEFRVKITRLATSPRADAITPPPCPDSQASAGDVLDARGLEPPEPMLRILGAAAALAAGRTLEARTDRRPVNLYPELDARNIRHSSEELADGSWITRLSRG